jgi:3-hydroxyacyl-CoA dehydrogenase/enoyl-CoA hydratase/3-hydroxybutyryl-CoA epimerase/3-hydroxyacyl-CoA dehydrogenase/enoyl-CoA hydratase/3-hydroxybutyryl-CoA epimerase/enoyl-CoA isomerase
MNASGAITLEEIGNGVAVATIDQPNSRANTMGQALLAELETLAGQLAKRTDLSGFVLRSGKPGMFIAGADLRELRGIKITAEIAQMVSKRGQEVIAQFENLPFPTIAAIDGSCMGGGLELALGFDYRLAGTHPKAELGFPEVKVGIIPGWGGTQRLPRVIGPSLAAEMICGGEAVSAEKARAIGLIFDLVPSEKLIEESARLVKWARQTEAWRGLRKRKHQPIGLSEEQHSFTFAVAKSQVMTKTKGRFPAPLAALEAIAKGCNEPLEDGLKAETAVFVPLLGSPISRNLVGVFFMTQRLQKDTGVADATIQPRTIQRVGVVGAGLMGSGIAGANIGRGIPVMMIDNIAAAVDKGRASITKTLQGRVDIGRSSTAEMIASLGRLSAATTNSALAGCDLIIEAIVENESAKVQLYRDLETLLPPEGILASNTSTLSITRMSKLLANPDRFAGLHFFNPVDRMALVEVIRGDATNASTVATLVALAKRLGKIPIVVGDCPGFLVNRILFPYLNESLVLLEEGAAPRAVDQAATDFGMPMGPVTLNDLVGLDTSLYAGRVVNTAFADRAVKTRILDELVAAGRLGQKSGAGFYNYAKGSRGADDPGFAAILERCRTGKRAFSQNEIAERLFLPMLTEACRILEEGIVREPGDVDMGLILGIGFPAFRGGLMHWADSVGPEEVLKKLQKYESLGARFTPPALLRKWAKEKKGFYPDN